MNIKQQPRATWPRAFTWALCAAVLAMAQACGGGGGGSTPETPRFESTSVGGVAGIRDNATGRVWAAQAGSTGLEPSALDLLTLSDAGLPSLQTYFGFAAGKYVQAAETAPNSVWVVDFGLDTAGRLSNEAVDPQRPFAQMRLLLPTGTLTALDDNLDGTANQARLMWSLCTEGTTYERTSGRCVGTPTPMTLAQAKALAASSTRSLRTGWRLPTKQELQNLLRLGTAAATLLPTLIENVDNVSGVQPLPYFTGNTVSRPGLGEQPWVVDFSAGSDPGGVEYVSDPASNPAVAYVRLVRNW